MIDFAHTVYIIVIWLFLLYSAAVFLVYSWIGIYAFGAVRRYKNENTFTDYGIIASNPNAPTFSLIAPEQVQKGLYVSSHQTSTRFD